MSQIGFIGYGEVGYHFSLGFRQMNLEMAAFVRNPDKVREKAEDTSVKLLPSIEDLASSSETIFSCVWPSSALSVAGECAKFLAPGQVYLDVNSISPHTTQEIANLIAPSGADFVKLSIMYAVPLYGIKVPVLAGGARAGDIAQRLKNYGMNVRAIATDPKRPAAIKILRAACLKGIVALLFETLLAAHKYGLREEIMDSISEVFASAPFASTVGNWICSTAIHAQRRAGEMDEAIATIVEVGVAPEMAQTTRRVLEQIAAKNLRQRFSDEQAPSYVEVLDALT